MISFEGMPQTFKVDLRNFLNSELDCCLKRCERAETKRSFYKRSKDHQAVMNLSGTILHYEGRVLEIERTLRFLDGETPIQTPFVLDIKNGTVNGQGWTNENI